MAGLKEKLKKLYSARSNHESELRNIHREVTDAIGQRGEQKQRILLLGK